MDYDSSAFVADYQRKRDLLADGLRKTYEFELPGGAFYLFPKAPWGTGTEFVAEAIKHNLLMIPGNVFSRRDTHFRISYAATDETLRRGIDVLNRLANARLNRQCIPLTPLARADSACGTPLSARLCGPAYPADRDVGPDVTGAAHVSLAERPEIRRHAIDSIDGIRGDRSLEQSGDSGICPRRML